MKKTLYSILIFIGIIACLLIGADFFVKSSFGKYSDVRYRFVSDEWIDFFSHQNMQSTGIYKANSHVAMLELFFNSNERISGMDMNFVQKNSKTMSKYKTSYNMRGAGFSNIMYTGRYSSDRLDESNLGGDNLWIKGTPLVFDALANLSLQDFYMAFPNFDIYHLSLRDFADIQKTLKEWNSKNAYIVDKDKITKLEANDVISDGIYAVFMVNCMDNQDLQRDFAQQSEDVMKNNPEDYCILYLKL